MTIRSRVATEEYRREFDRVFPKKRPRRSEPDGCVECQGGLVPLNPHDAQEHPEAD